MSEQVIHNLKFDDQGLITAIVQDHVTNQVLMVAYMNGDSLARTLQTGQTWFWSRSRRELWHKGATSGNTQKVVDIRMDCDGDALLVRVIPEGPACHTGEYTCFYRGADDSIDSVAADRPAASGVSLVNVAAMDLGILLQDLYQLIQERKDQRPVNSYTTYLFNSGLDKILKKVGEESAETIIAAKNTESANGHQQLSAEISDLLYHLLVLMVEREVSLQDILAELSNRSGKPPRQQYGKPL